MGTVRIAHISDLHFGASFQEGTWGILQHHLREQVENKLLHLVLVTGDIVDTPKARLFERAREALESLGVEYFVCAGNHDRHPLGNSWRVIRAINWATRRTANFSEYFEGKVPTLDDFKTVPLASDNDKWNVRIAAVDSSLKADISARGFVELPIEKVIGKAMDNADDVDLGILLIHHHLMPIRVLEVKHAQRSLQLGGLTRLTALVNAGSVMESLARAHFDIALHGHEHASNWARYGTLEDGGGEMVVLAAGSATGTVTLRPCAPELMSYNMLTLRPDRSVEIFVLQHVGQGKWETRRRFEVMSSEDSRRQRFLRRAKDSPQAAEIVKVMEWRGNGDGVINQYQTDWGPQQTGNQPGQWTLMAINTTGHPTDLRVRFIAPGDEPLDLEPSFQALQGQFYTWEASLPLDHEFFNRHAGRTLLVEESYLWKDGAILTAKQMNELLRARPDSLGPFRSNGLEFGALSIRRWFKSAMLVIRLPPDLAPDPTTLQVFIQRVENPDEILPFQAEVQNCLRILGEGLFSLIIPYPRKGYRYGLSWQPADR